MPRKKIETTVLTTENLQRAAAHLLKLAAEFELRDGGMFSNEVSACDKETCGGVWSMLKTDRRLAEVVQLLLDDADEREKQGRVAKAAPLVDLLVGFRAACEIDGRELDRAWVRRAAATICAWTQWTPTPVGLRMFEAELCAPQFKRTPDARTHAEAAMRALGHLIISSKATLVETRAALQGKTSRGMLNTAVKVRLSLNDFDVPSTRPLRYAIRASLPFHPQATLALANLLDRVCSAFMQAFRSTLEATDDVEAIRKLAELSQTQSATQLGIMNRVLEKLLPSDTLQFLGKLEEDDLPTALSATSTVPNNVVRIAEVTGVPVEQIMADVGSIVEWSIRMQKPGGTEDFSNAAYQLLQSWPEATR